MARIIASAEGRTVFRVDVPSETLEMYQDSESDDTTIFARSNPDTNPELTPESTPGVSSDSDPDFDGC